MNNNIILFYENINKYYNNFNKKDKQIYKPKLIKSNIENLKKIAKNFFQQSNLFNIINFDNNEYINIDYLSDDCIYIILPFIDSCIITPSNEYLRFLSSCLMEKYKKLKCIFLNIRFVRFPNRISFINDINSIYKKSYIENKKYNYLKVVDFQLINFSFNKEYNEKINSFLKLFNPNKRKLENFEESNEKKKIKILDTNNKKDSIGNRVSKRNKRSVKSIFGKNTDKWVSPTQTRNYLLKDPLIDWLKYYGEKNGYLPDNIIKGEYDYFSFIMERGQEFEKYVFDFLKKKYDSEIINISEENQYFSIENVNKTLNAIENKIPIIYQANLISYDKKTYGIADLIIRKDFIKENFNIKCEKIQEDLCNFDSDNNNYVVVDIKYSTLRNNKNNLLKNNGSVKCYKGQVMLYTDMLNEMQKTNEKYGFLLGRRLIDSDNNILDGKENLGIVEIEDHDSKIKEESYKAIEWIKWLRENGDNYHPLNNTIEQLMPNMCNRLDYPWHKMKKNISYAQSEITLLWNCGIKNRKKAMENNCNSFINNNFDINKIGLTDKKKKIVKPIIEINDEFNNEKYTNLESYLESNVDFNNINININENMIFFVDFEFLNTCEISFSHMSRTHLYMIGLGYINPNNKKWCYEVFITKKIEENEEKYIMRKWLNRINEIKEQYNKSKSILIHWSKAEPSLFNKLVLKYKLRVNVEWYDLLKKFKDIPFVQKNIYDFNLKNVAKKMKDNNLIETEWRSAVLDGLGASVAIIKGLKKVDNIDNIEEIEEIINYNEVDCKVLSEMYSYLKKFN